MWYPMCLEPPCPTTAIVFFLPANLDRVLVGFSARHYAAFCFLVTEHRSVPTAVLSQHMESFEVISNYSICSTKSMPHMATFPLLASKFHDIKRSTILKVVAYFDKANKQTNRQPYKQTKNTKQHTTLNLG